MPTRYNLPHVDISARFTSHDYSGDAGYGQGTPRERIEHGRRIQQELRTAMAAGLAARPADERLPAPTGIHLEVELDRGTPPDALDLKTQGVRVGAAKVDDANRRTISLYVPDHAGPVIEQIVEEYLHGELTKKAKQPPNKKRVESIEAIRQAHIGTRWTDPKPIPTDTQTPMWWALWCYRDRVAVVEDVCARLHVRASQPDRWMQFPEVVVIPVLANRATVELMMFATDAIAELRLANDNPAFFIDEKVGDQHDWVDGLAERVVWPGTETPSVCVLDTGVNRGHALIEPALVPDDMHALREDDEGGWGVDDHDPNGHGTAMAGLVLHGDLTAALSDQEKRTLTHRLESVKILPPAGFDASEPQSYGVLTQSAIVLPEIEAPERARVYCMAITNENVSGANASTWSAAIDQAACGRMIADGQNTEDAEEDLDRPKRLIVISAGNVPAESDFLARRSQDEFPIEDPAQAWNALTVGGYTDLVTVRDAGYTDWAAIAQAGELSPHSRTSARWERGISPIKPEIVMEAGNRAVNAARTEMVTVDSLSLLTTGSDVTRAPLVSFDATSAAAAQAARLAGQLMAARPDYWPETIRGLIVHSAEWTEPMRAGIYGTQSKRERYELARRFGYGVASFERAAASAKNHLAMVAQAEMQPYHFTGGRDFHECHYYDLPVPASMLEELDNEPVELKVTLSYFIDPNPGLSANVDPQRYQSHGLRFDLQRRNESFQRFKYRVNSAERPNKRQKYTHEPSDPKWTLGDDSISAGSLHCDIWVGRAIELLQRNRICIKPVNGWARQRADKKVCERKTRYSLIVSLKTQNVDLDIHTPISTAVRTPVEVETPV